MKHCALTVCVCGASHGDDCFLQVRTRTVKELADLIAMGRDNRRVGATDANAHSSRSHRFGVWAVRFI